MIRKAYQEGRFSSEADLKRCRESAWPASKEPGYPRGYDPVCRKLNSVSTTRASAHPGDGLESFSGDTGARCDKVAQIMAASLGVLLMLEEMNPELLFILSRKTILPEGMDESFDAMFFIGQHAMINMYDGVLNHTLSYLLRIRHQPHLGQ